MTGHVRAAKLTTGHQRPRRCLPDTAQPGKCPQVCPKESRSPRPRSTLRAAPKLKQLREQETWAYPLPFPLGTLDCPLSGRDAEVFCFFFINLFFGLAGS